MGSDSSENKTTAKIKVSSSTNTTEPIKSLMKPTVKKPTVESKKLAPVKESTGKPPGKLKKPEVKITNEDSSNPEVEFILKVKSSKKEPVKKVGINI